MSTSNDARISAATAPVTLPPAMIGEPAWDILLALHSDARCQLSLSKLASLVSVPAAALNRWLSALEDRRLITGAGIGAPASCAPC